MSENKAFITQPGEQGTLHIADEVVASIAALAVNEVEGVATLSKSMGSDITEIITRRALSRGVKVRANDSEITVDVYVVVRYGNAVNIVARKVQESVKSAIESMAGISVTSVNVHVAGIALRRREPQK